jgi:hypothetical protein
VKGFLRRNNKEAIHWMVGTYAAIGDMKATKTSLTVACGQALDRDALVDRTSTDSTRATCRDCAKLAQADGLPIREVR